MSSGSPRTTDGGDVSSESLALLTEHSNVEFVAPAIDGTVDDMSPFLALPSLKHLSLYPVRFGTGLGLLTRSTSLDGLDFAPLAGLRHLTIDMYEGQRVRGPDQPHRTVKTNWRPRS